MTIPKLLDLLRDLDVRIRLEGERLRYNAPKNALTPELRNTLLERKPEIIAFLREVGSRARAAFSPILSASVEKEPPLSSAQQRLWFIDRFEEGRPLYHIGAAVRLSGVLSPSALERSLNEIIRRHETLRSTFVTRDGKPLLQIAPALSLSLDMTDLSTVPPVKREEEVLRLAASEARRPFDLSQGPLLRTLLLRLGPVDHVVLFTMHHIVSDGWSVGVLLRELSVLYEPFVNGLPSPLPELPVHYSDFSHWQREWLKGPDKDAQLAYWKERLSGLHPLPDLPADRPRPAVQTFRGALRNFTMPADLADSIASLCRREEVTPFMALLAVFQGLLYRYTGQEDLGVGAPVAGRNRAEIEPLIGCFVNTLVLRTDLSGNPTFRELLGRVREVTLGAYSHQDLPFDVLVSALQAQDGHGRPPLFQVMFILQNAPADPPRLPGMDLTLMDVDNGSALFELILTISDREGTLHGTFEYSRDLFDAATIERMVGHFETLARSCLENPDRPISEMALLREPERRQVLMEWNDTSSCFPSDTCIQELFEEQVKRTPDALAVVYEDSSLTYGELNRRANQVARFLQQRGVGPDVPVGLCVDRSVEMVVGWLGILKAGGAYVPLDPAYPPERLAFMIEDSGVRVILTPRGSGFKVGFRVSRKVNESNEDRGAGSQKEGQDQRRRSEEIEGLSPGPSTSGPGTLDLCLQPPTSNLQQ